MLQQFRRAIGVQIVRGNTMLKMSTLHYVRETPQQAKEVHQANMSNIRYRPNKEITRGTVNTQLLDTTHSNNSETSTGF